MKAFLKFTLQVLYNVGFMAFFLVAGWYLLFRLWRRGKLLPQFGQRFGFYSKSVRDKLAPGADLWIHAVSVGEVKIARVLLLRLRELRPDLRVVISTTTGTGSALAKKRLADDRTVVIYNPIDFLWSVVHAFQLIRPRLLILVESEIWPNYLWCAKRRHIPIYLINTRLSDKSEERYRKMRRLVRPLLSDIDLVFAQDPTEVSRLAQAGFAAEAIFNLGSMKYDVAEQESIDARDATKGKGHQRMVGSHRLERRAKKSFWAVALTRARKKSSCASSANFASRIRSSGWCSLRDTPNAARPFATCATEWG